MAENGDKVSKNPFSLLAILNFLIVLAGICLGYLFSAQATDRAIAQLLGDRVLKLETHYGYIISGIEELKTGQEKQMAALAAHEKSSASALRLKKWQDYK